MVRRVGTCLFYRCGWAGSFRLPEADLLVTWSRFRRFVLLEPLLGLLFDGRSLGLREARRNKRGEHFAGIIAAGAGEHGPEVGAIRVLRDAAAAPVKRTQFRLSGNIAMLSRAAKPAGRFRLVRYDCLLFVALGIEKA